MCTQGRYDHLSIFLITKKGDCNHVEILINRPVRVADETPLAKTLAFAFTACSVALIWVGPRLCKAVSFSLSFLYWERLGILDRSSIRVIYPFGVFLYTPVLLRFSGCNFLKITGVGPNRCFHPRPCYLDASSNKLFFYF